METLFIWASILGLAILFIGVLMTTKQDVLDAITGVNSQLAKAKDEIVAKIEALETAAGNGAGLDEILAALGGVKASAQALDDIVPDAAPEDPPAEG